MSFVSDFLSNATLVEESVDVFQKAGLAARYELVRRELVAAEQLAAQNEVPGEELMSSGNSVLADLEARAREILTELQESKTTWFFGALSDEDEEAIATAYPLPHNPYKPLDDPFPQGSATGTNDQAVAWLEAIQLFAKRADEHRSKWEQSPEAEQYALDVEKVSKQRAAERIRRAFRRIEKNGEVVATQLTFDEILQIPHSLGDVVFKLMNQAIEKATNTHVDVTTDFLESN